METEETSPIADDQSSEKPAPFDTPDDDHPPVEETSDDGGETADDDG